jgi:hypothetical protein
MKRKILPCRSNLFHSPVCLKPAGVGVILRVIPFAVSSDRKSFVAALALTPDRPGERGHHLEPETVYKACWPGPQLEATSSVKVGRPDHLQLIQPTI